MISLRVCHIHDRTIRRSSADFKLQLFFRKLWGNKKRTLANQNLLLGKIGMTCTLSSNLFIIKNK